MRESLTLAGVEGFVTSGSNVVKNVVVKGTIKVGAEATRNATGVKTDKSKVSGLTTGTNAVTVIAINTTVGLVGRKIEV